MPVCAHATYPVDGPYVGMHLVAPWGAPAAVVRFLQAGQSASTTAAEARSKAVECVHVSLCALQNLNAADLEFKAWDYGTNCSIGAPFQETCNQMKYGSLQPYVYDLSKVTAPQVSHARS